MPSKRLAILDLVGSKPGGGQRKSRRAARRGERGRGTMRCTVHQVGPLSNVAVNDFLGGRETIRHGGLEPQHVIYGDAFAIRRILNLGSRIGKRISQALACLMDRQRGRCVNDRSFGDDSVRKRASGWWCLGAAGETRSQSQGTHGADHVEFLAWGLKPACGLGGGHLERCRIRPARENRLTSPPLPRHSQALLRQPKRTELEEYFQIRSIPDLNHAILKNGD